LSYDVEGITYTHTHIHYLHTLCLSLSLVQTHPGRRTMGWLRLVGSLKLQISFAKEPYKRAYTLQKRPIILRRLLIIATPYDVEGITYTHTLSPFLSFSLSRCTHDCRMTWRASPIHTLSLSLFFFLSLAHIGGRTIDV